MHCSPVHVPRPFCGIRPWSWGPDAPRFLIVSSQDWMLTVSLGSTDRILEQTNKISSFSSLCSKGRLCVGLYHLVSSCLLPVGVPPYLFTVGAIPYIFTIWAPLYIFTVEALPCMFAVRSPPYTFTVGAPPCTFTVGAPPYMFTAEALPWSSWGPTVIYRCAL